MGSGPSQTTQSTSQTSPWAPTQGALTGVLGQLMSNPMTPSANQTTAAQNLVNATGALPNYGAQGQTVANTLLSGGGANNFAPLFQNAYNTYSSQIAPTADPSSIDPMNNPAIKSLINTTNQDTTNSIDSQFAAAGMTGSPANAQALSRGLSQGESGILTGQYNTDVANQNAAASNLFNAGNTNAGALAGLNQTALGNMQQGIGVAGQIPGLSTAPAQAQLGAANAQAQMPYQNLGWLTSLLYPMAALGGQGSGSSTTTGSQSMFGNFLGGLLGGAGALGSLGGSGGLPSLVNMFSDARVKDDIEQVGMLFDGLPVYSFRYKGDITPRIGLMAQDVEKVAPGAVSEFGNTGIKMVDYRKATERATAMAA
jgi:Chaperone of endosialidase